VFLIQHFREPMPLQTTAMDQVSTVMGSGENVVAGLATLCKKARPDCIGVPTTGLAETQGNPLYIAVQEFRKRHPEWDEVALVPVSAPDYKGSMESGYAAAVEALIETLVPVGGVAPTRKVPCGTAPQVNVLAGAFLTPGDIEVLKDTIEVFGLRPVVMPDLGDSLDGHLVAEDFSPCTVGGTPVSSIRSLGSALATLAIGPSMFPAAERLAARTAVPVFRFDHLLGLDAFDQLVLTLREVSGRAVPERLTRHRAQLQDALLDTHFILGGRRVAIGADPDLLNALSHFLAEVGAETVTAVAAAGAPILVQVAAPEIQVGDLEDLENHAREQGAELILGNSHAAETAHSLGLPLLRVGFPQYDRVGGYQETRIGYRGARQLLFDLANLLQEGLHHGVRPYRSLYAQDKDRPPAQPPTPTASRAAGLTATIHGSPTEPCPRRM
jgi:nitrogenase molybdenum-iron protein NifN